MRTDIQPPTAVSPPPSAHGRPSRSWLWPGIGVAAVGVVAGLVFGFSSYRDSQEKIDAFARMAVPGTMAVQIADPARQVVYYEGDPAVGIDDLMVGIVGPGGVAVAVAPYEGELVYERTDLTLGRAVASFNAAQTGPYEIEVTGVDRGEITVGESFSRLALPGILFGLAIAVLSLVGGFAMGLLGFVRR